MNTLTSQNLSKYYSITNILSHQMYFNLLIGHRGVGKTYGFKKWCIKDYVENDNQFVWVRRYRSEMTTIDQLFDDQLAALHKEYGVDEVKIKMGKLFGTCKINGKVAGFFIPLSTSLKIKSTAFKKELLGGGLQVVNKIIFDEFLIKKGGGYYLPDEVEILLELMSTVERDRDDLRGVYLLGNNISFANPYTLYFGIPSFTQRFYKDKTRGVLVEKYENRLYIDHMKTTRFGKLISGTKYADYALENKALQDNSEFIEKRDSNSEFRCAIRYEGGVFGFWLNYKTGVMYANKQYDPKSYNIYSLTRDDHTHNTLLVKTFNTTRIKDVMICFRTGALRFETQQVKHQVYKLLSHFIR